MEKRPKWKTTKMEDDHLTLSNDHLTLTYNTLTLTYGHLTLTYDHLTLTYEHLTLTYDHLTLTYDQIPCSAMWCHVVPCVDQLEPIHNTPAMLVFVRFATFF